MPGLERNRPRSTSTPPPSRGEPTQKKAQPWKILFSKKQVFLWGVTWLGTALTPPCQHCCFCQLFYRVQDTCAIGCRAPFLPGSTIHSRFYLKKKKNPSPNCKRTEKECVLKRCLHSWLPAQASSGCCSDLPERCVKPSSMEQGRRGAR